MPIIKTDNIELPELQVFGSLTESQLRNRLEPEKGIFIAESPKVIRIALQRGYEPVSLLMEEKHLTGDAADIVAQLPDSTPVYMGSRELLAQLTGYKLTRGVLCAMRRPTPLPLGKVLESARRVVVIDGVVDTTNIGAIFRSAAALGIDGALLMPNACDPLNRRAVRVSMGTVFLLPWTWLNSYDDLRPFGFKTVAMALTDKSIQLTSPELKAGIASPSSWATRATACPPKLSTGRTTPCAYPWRTAWTRSTWQPPRPWRFGNFANNI